MFQVLLGAFELLSKFIGIANDALHFFLIDLEELTGLEVHYPLLEFRILPLQSSECIFQLSNSFFELLCPGKVDFSRGLGVVRGLCIGEEGLFGAKVVESVLDILRP